MLVSEGYIHTWFCYWVGNNTFYWLIICLVYHAGSVFEFVIFMLFIKNENKEIQMILEFRNKKEYLHHSWCALGSSFLGFLTRSFKYFLVKNLEFLYINIYKYILSFALLILLISLLSLWSGIYNLVNSSSMYRYVQHSIWDGKNSGLSSILFLWCRLGFYVTRLRRY